MLTKQRHADSDHGTHSRDSHLQCSEQLTATTRTGGSARDLDDDATSRATDDDAACDRRCVTYVVGEQLGEGTYGAVFLAHEQLSGRCVVVKQMFDVFVPLLQPQPSHPRRSSRPPPPQLLFHEARQASALTRSDALTSNVGGTVAVREVKLLHMLGPHPNIVPLLDVVLCPDSPSDAYAVLECMDCDLRKVLRARRWLDAGSQRSILYQILCGVAHMHQAGVLHRDIKPENVLVSATRTGFHVRIADLGMARPLMGPVAPGGCDGWTGDVVTTLYRAPELLTDERQGGYTTALDVWSVGCVAGELANGGTPMFEGADPASILWSIRELLANGRKSALYDPHSVQVRRERINRVINRWTTLDPHFLDLLDSLLATDEHRRCTAIEALAHPYFADVTLPDDVPVFRPLTASEVQRFVRLRHEEFAVEDKLARSAVEPTGGQVRAALNAVARAM